MKNNYVLENSLSLLQEIKASLNQAKTLKNKVPLFIKEERSNIKKQLTPERISHPMEKTKDNTESINSFLTSSKPLYSIVVKDPRNGRKQQKQRVNLRTGDMIIQDMRRFQLEFEQKCSQLERKIMSAIETTENENQEDHKLIEEIQSMMTKNN